MAIRDVVLLIVGVQLIQSDQHLSGFEIAFWLTVLLTVGARLIDIRHFAGTDRFGVPSTLAEWRRYATKMVSLAGIVWLVMHLVIALRRSTVIPAIPSR